MARIFTDAGGQLLTGASQTQFVLDTFSVALWLYRTATPAATADLISAAGATSGWIIQLLASNLIRGLIPAATTNKVRDSSTIAALNTWHHIVVTHQKIGLLSTDFQFYFNGKQEAGTNNASQSGAHTNVAGTLILGANANFGNRAAPVRYGPLAIWDRAITPAEALALAGGAHPLRFKTGLIDMFEMQTEHSELGLVSNTYLVRGATNPTSAAVNPPMEPIPTALLTERQNYRTRRARYFVPAASGFTPLQRRTRHAFGTHVGGRTQVNA